MDEDLNELLSSLTEEESKSLLNKFEHEESQKTTTLEDLALMEESIQKLRLFVPEETERTKQEKQKPQQTRTNFELRSYDPKQYLNDDLEKLLENATSDDLESCQGNSATIQNYSNRLT
ncbi:hypothetical protein RF11_10347 [Thelohanellus kitauei]|uniref:Uncharacterized protein n=1 Tax=Thelohanellus kitauei TaxID=669202 RepID=A0A0C2N535_THEKT|nr:hypothetical protein RF11_10347 [Thelohanellus kitauei]